MSDLKLVSYNICDSGQQEEIIDNLLDFSKQGVNMFCLQEVRRPKDGPFIGDSLLEKLGSGWQAEFFLSDSPASSDYGLGILWRSDVIKPVKFERLTFPSLDQLNGYEQLVELIQRKNADPIKRGALIGTFVMHGRNVKVSNLHLDWHGGFKHRFNQLRYLMDNLKSELPHGEIICGDFNTVSFINTTKEQIQKINSLLGSEFTNAIPQFRPSTIFFQHLDHIFARNFGVKHAKIHARLGSDHYPVVALLALDPVPVLNQNSDL